MNMIFNSDVKFMVVVGVIFFALGTYIHFTESRGWDLKCKKISKCSCDGEYSYLVCNDKLIYSEVVEDEKIEVIPPERSSENIPEE